VAEGKATHLTKRVVESFKARFLDGELKPGEALPSERELAAQLNVSRTTVRDAITALRVMGLVEVKQGKCATVTAPSVENILEPLMMVFPMEQANILNLLEFREIFEPQCVFLATKRAAPNEIQQIGEYLKEMRRLQGDTARYAEADYHFHQAIMKATHNEMIVVFTTVFRNLLYNLQKRMAALPEPEPLLITHERVYEAMVLGDPQQAADRMRELVANTKADYIRSTLNPAPKDGQETS
jgi:DNA-binding FadR family transcriptional regulator